MLACSCLSWECYYVLREQPPNDTSNGVLKFSTCKMRFFSCSWKENLISMQTSFVDGSEIQTLDLNKFQLLPVKKWCKSIESKFSSSLETVKKRKILSIPMNYEKSVFQQHTSFEREKRAENRMNFRAFKWPSIICYLWSPHSQPPQATSDSIFFPSRPQKGWINAILKRRKSYEKHRVRLRTEQKTENIYPTQKKRRRREIAARKTKKWNKTVFHLDSMNWYFKPLKDINQSGEIE